MVGRKMFLDSFSAPERSALPLSQSEATERTYNSISFKPWKETLAKAMVELFPRYKMTPLCHVRRRLLFL